MKAFYTPLLALFIAGQANAQDFIEAMEPVSEVLTAPAKLIAEEITRYMAEQNNYHRTAKKYQYNGQDIYFEHFNWRVIGASVCSNHTENTTQFSDCTLAAKELFGITCLHLSTKQNKSNQENRMSNMFCQAATNFKPTIIQISKAEAPTELEKLRSNCNRLIAAAMGNSDASIAAKRDEACNHYKFESLKNK